MVHQQMSQELVISSNPVETAVAILENDNLVEIHVEQHADKAIAGSIYKGRVSRVLPGMQSAFVQLGLARDAFLYVTDVLEQDDVPQDLQDEESVPGEAAADGGSALSEPVEAEVAGEAPRSEESGEGAPPRKRRRRRRRSRSGERREESAAATAAAPAAGDDDAAAAADRGGPERAVSGGPAVLPGESLAKYRDEAKQSSAEAGDAGEGDLPRTQAEAPDSAPEESAADNAAPAPSEAAASAAGAEPSAGPAGSTEEPPRKSAEVAGPSVLAELRWDRIASWFQRKPAAEAAGDREPKPPRPAAGREPRPESRPMPGAPAAPPRKRGGRRPAATARSGSERTAGGRSGGARRPRSRKERSDLPSRDRQPDAQANIADLLKTGQEIIVQVVKEPVGSKGARITSHVSLPGRYMVYMTTAKHNGVARKIQPDKERNRLRKIVDRCSAGKPGGFVVRTAGRGVTEEELQADAEFLYKLWQSIQDKAGKRKSPAKLHSDLDIVERMLRDQLGQSYTSIWVDSEDEYQRIVRFVERFQPGLLPNVKLYGRPEPIFDSFGISKDLEKALKPRVWLKSGGYLIINQTEALVAVDVNTGRYVGKSDRLEDTVLKTNLEAAEEIVRQLRLRDLGGIIVIDFIDMEDRKNRQKVQQVLQDALRQNRSPSRVLPFNDFGLVVITRKAVRQSLERSLCAPCPVCSGGGTVKSSATVLSEIFATARRRAANGSKRAGGAAKDATLRVHPEVAKSLKVKSASHLQDLEQALGAHVLVRGDASMHPGEFSFS